MVLADKYVSVITISLTQAYINLVSYMYNPNFVYVYFMTETRDYFGYVSVLQNALGAVQIIEKCIWLPGRKLNKTLI